MHTTHKITIYVPATYNVCEETPAGAAINVRDYVAERMAIMFGNSASERAFAYYVDKEGKLVKERVYKVYAFALKPVSDTQAECIRGLAFHVKNVMRQETVLYNVEQVLEATFV